MHCCYLPYIYVQTPLIDWVMYTCSMPGAALNHAMLERSLSVTALWEGRCLSSSGPEWYELENMFSRLLQ